MVERNLPPEMSTYRAAINGSCDAGNLDVAVGFLDQMRTEGHEPDMHVQVS